MCTTTCYDPDEGKAFVSSVPCWTLSGYTEDSGSYSMVIEQGNE